MNQAPVGLENGADRAATSRENPVLFPAPNEHFRENGSFYLLQRNIKAKTGLEEAVVNQATVGTVKYYAQIHLQVWQNSVCTGQGNLPLIT